MERRRFLETTGVAAVASLARLDAASANPPAAEAGWRTFEVRTRLEITGATDGTKAWIPLPLGDTSYQKRLGDTWTGNASRCRERQDSRYGARMLCVEWSSREAAPLVEVTSRFSTTTRDRAVDLAQPDPGFPRENRATIQLYLQPTHLIPTDGIVRETSNDIVKGQTSDLGKARAIYGWIVENTFRDPKVAGCGIGNIKTMLETRYMGGKCADLNALFVGLARAAGIPARDVYGIRAAESKEFKSLGRSGDITKAQHCRAEFYAEGHGWIPVDPADVRKVVLEEPPGGRALDDPLVQRARQKLFGAWETNWLAYNYAHDLRLPGAARGPIGFLMYPQCETKAGPKDPLDPAGFKYQISVSQLAS
jgi:transglutaminase-like putative cysteine protease